MLLRAFQVTADGDAFMSVKRARDGRAAHTALHVCCGFNEGLRGMRDNRLRRQNLNARTLRAHRVRNRRHRDGGGRAPHGGRRRYLARKRQHTLRSSRKPPTQALLCASGLTTDAAVSLQDRHDRGKDRRERGVVGDCARGNRTRRGDASTAAAPRRPCRVLRKVLRRRPRRDHLPEEQGARRTVLRLLPQLRHKGGHIMLPRYCNTIQQLRTPWRLGDQLPMQFFATKIHCKRYRRDGHSVKDRRVAAPRNSDHDKKTDAHRSAPTALQTPGSSVPPGFTVTSSPTSVPEIQWISSLGNSAPHSASLCCSTSHIRASQSSNEDASFLLHETWTVRLN